jgi:hypothetical protein
MLAITRSFPPQLRQTSMSMANTRLRRCAQVSARCRPPRSLAAAARVLGTIRARSGLAGREYAVIAGQVRTRLRHQRREPRNEVLGLEDHVGRAVPIRRLQRIAHLAIVR